MGRKQTVVISDIHMGTNTATNWYQHDIHEPYLAHILEWVIANRTDIDELVILGDLFDFWTCAPDETPPTAAQIVAANPGILGASGLLSSVLTALQGRVSYLHGNHDITTTQADLNEIRNSSHTITLRPDIYVTNGVVYTHGHLFTMFNAPDHMHPLPVGHFVTRAISYFLKHNGQQAALESGFGVPQMGYGGLKTILETIVYPGILAHLNDIVDFSVTREFLTVIQNTTGIPDNYPVQLERGLGATTFAQVKNTYAHLWSDWMKRYGAGQGLMRGFMFAYKAAYADYDGSYLGWFAQQLAFQHSAGLVVMGHTHIPIAGLEGDIANYINAGFECVPVPDLGKDKMTYSLITTDNGKPVASEVLAVTRQGSQYQSTSATPPKAGIGGSLAKDYSCYLTVENRSAENYVLVPDSTRNNYGYYAVLPPVEIPAGAIVRFWLQDSPGIAGADGEVTYRGRRSGRAVRLTFGCAFLNMPFNRNHCDGADEFYSKSGSVHNNWGARHDVATSANPLFVRFVIS